MIKFGLLLFLIVLALVFIWVCSASFFKAIGNVVGKFFEPFKKDSKESVDK